MIRLGEGIWDDRPKAHDPVAYALEAELRVTVDDLTAAKPKVKAAAPRKDAANAP